MTGENIQTGTELYDSMSQPVSYAVVYGLVPEMRKMIISEKINESEKGI